MKLFKPILCLDFDGVIHSYSGKWAGMGVVNDPPVPGVADWIEEASKHFVIAVYSSRSKSLRGRRAIDKISMPAAFMLVFEQKYKQEKKRRAA